MRQISIGVLFILLVFSWTPVLAQSTVIPDAQGASKLAYKELGHLEYEGAIIYFLNEANHILKTARVSQGITDGIYYVPWELVLPFHLPQGTQTVYLVHNHPGGNPHLSEEDIQTGCYWAQWAYQKGVNFDLLAITPEGGYTSLQEQGLFIPNEEKISLPQFFSDLLGPSLALATSSLRRTLLPS